MGRIRTDRLIGFDTEWTCWEGEPPEGMESEIVEIGVVEYDPRAREIVREGRYLVRPSRSTVGAFCTGLTGLTHEEVVRDGRPLREVVRTLAKDFGTGWKPSVAWGNDWSGLQRECERAGAPNPFRPEGYTNLGLLYGLMTGSEARVGQSAAMEALDVEMTGSAHRGVDDARNLIRVFQAMSAALPEAAPLPGP